MRKLTFTVGVLFALFLLWIGAAGLASGHVTIPVGYYVDATAHSAAYAMSGSWISLAMAMFCSTLLPCKQGIAGSVRAVRDWAFLVSALLFVIAVIIEVLYTYAGVNL